MPFVKRNVVLSGGPSAAPPSPSRTTPQSPTNRILVPSSPTSSSASPSPHQQQQQNTAPIPGVRPSPVTGVPTTSTGAPTLDTLCGGGIPLGSLLLIEESSTTDFAGALLRYYTAEGIVQSHQVVLLHSGDGGWLRELPAVTGVADGTDDEESRQSRPQTAKEKERMKIAWRYEGLRSFGSGIHTRRETPSPQPSQQQQQSSAAAADAPQQTIPPSQSQSQTTGPFCHTYDLTKRLIPPQTSPKPSTIDIPQHTPSPFPQILQSLTKHLETITPPNVLIRVVIPNFLSPMLYPPTASHPQQALQFLHSLRALLRRYASRMTVMMSLSLALYPREGSGYVRCMENIADGVIELTPLSQLAERRAEALGGGGKGKEDAPQGLVRVWKSISLGVKRGAAWSGMGMKGGDDLAFTLSRRRFGIVAYSLPPADGDDDGNSGGGGGSGGGAGGGKGEGGKQTKVDLEF